MNSLSRSMVVVALGCGGAFFPAIAAAGLLSPGALSPVTPATPVARILIGVTPVSLPIGGGKVMTTLYVGGPPPIALAGTGNRDPYINYSLSVTNTTSSDLFFEFAFGIPITPEGDNSALNSDLSVTLIDGGDGLVALTPTYDGIHSSTGLQRGLLSSDGGASFNLADEFGPLGGAITAAGFSTYHFSQAASASPVVTTFDYLELLVGFNLSPGDTAIFNGEIAIAVPEPSTLCLSMTCALAMLLYSRRSLRVHCQL